MSAQMDGFNAGWARALRGVQACLICAFDAPEVRPWVEIALDALGEAFEAAQALAFTNLETRGFYDIAPPVPASALSPAIRQVMTRRICVVTDAPTRRELKERLAEEGAGAVILTGPDGLSPRFIAHALARAAADCALTGEPPGARALRRVHPLTAKLIVLGALERADRNNATTCEAP